MVDGPPPMSARIDGAAMLVIIPSTMSMTSAARITKSAAHRHRYGAAPGGAGGGTAATLVWSMTPSSVVNNVQ